MWRACRIAAFLTAVPLQAWAASICEFPHPHLVVQFHPSARESFSLSDIDQALGKGVSAVELDLRLRASDGVVVCSHSRRDLERRPTLEQALDRVPVFQGASRTVQRDGFQFFLVLDFKERSPALYDGVVAALRERAARWSTAGDDGVPRGVTVIASGERAGLMARIPAATLDSLFIVEGVDYTGRILDRSPEPRRTFQWVAIQHPMERGRVRSLHHGTDLAGRGVFNVRVYDAHGAIGWCAASGVDAVNADRGEIAAAVRLARP